MKKLLLVVGIVGSGILLSGQGPAPSNVRVHADRIERRGEGRWHYSGSVQIETQSVVIRADEADGTNSLANPTTFDLRGNVQVIVNSGK
jgi:hypothetical protein